MMLAHSPKVVQRWKIPDFLNGIRADHYLVYHIGRISRSKAQRIIHAGDFRLEYGPLKASKRLKAGDAVELWRTPPDSAGERLPDIPIVYEDNDLLVLNKPGNLAVHPSARYLYQTVTNWLKVHYPGQAVHPCHRLDRETSGLLLCAKNLKTESTLKKAFMEGAIQKTYWALVEGRMIQPIVCKRPLSLQGNRGLVAIKMIEDPCGSPAETELQPLSYNPVLQNTLVECKPKTGKQHQIRAHLALEGHPIVGDKLYGLGEVFFDAYTKGQADLTRLALPRHALHAKRLELNLNEKQHDFECDNALFQPMVI